LAAFFDRHCPALVDIGSEIDKTHAALCLLARLDPQDRQGDVTAERFAQELFSSEVSKKNAAYAVQRWPFCSLLTLCYRTVGQSHLSYELEQQHS
jgi:hypothetical protein